MHQFFKLYLFHSGFFGLIFDFCLVSIALLALADWQATRSPVELADVSELVSYSGKVELKRPWKTDPYIVFQAPSGQSIRFSCFGPYRRQYWCDSVDINAAENHSEVKLMAADDLVYEIEIAGKPLLTYDQQVHRFQLAISEGPSNVKLFFSFFITCLLAISVRSRIKKATSHSSQMSA